MMLWSHVPVSYNVIYVIPIFVDLILITFGVSAILAHFGVFFDDLKNITNVGLRILFYMSGIFYGDHRQESMKRSGHIVIKGESRGISDRCLPVVTGLL